MSESETSSEEFQKGFRAAMACILKISEDMNEISELKSFIKTGMKLFDLIQQEEK